MQKYSLYCAQALSGGYVIIPNIIFSYLQYQNFSDFEFVLPFVLLYSFEKAGIFFIDSFKEVKNPLKILKFSLIIADAGAFLSLFDFRFSKSVSAVLLGFSLSFYMPFYRTVTDILKEENLWKFKNSVLKGYVFLVFILLSIFFFGKISINLVFFIFFLILLSSSFFVFNLPVPSYLNEKPAFYGGTKPKDFVIFTLVLFLTLSIRALKQTANTLYIIYMAGFFLLIVILDFFSKRPAFHLCSVKTAWYGAYKNFIIIFSLMYFMSLKSPKYLDLSYIMIAVGMILSLYADKYTVFSFKNSDKTLISMIVFSSGLLIFDRTYFLAIIILIFLISSAEKNSLKSYMDDDFFSIERKRTVRAKFYNLGSIINQFFLLITLCLICLIYKNDASLAVNSYRLHFGYSDLEDVFFTTKIISIFFLNIFGIFLILKENFHIKNNNF